MSEPIIFYDIPRRTTVPEENAWSANTWKTRYSLNVKGIPYKTIWVEYPDIETLCLKIGAAATEKKADGSPHYTLPVIYDPNTKTVVADSAAIARYLDKTYPDTPTLIPRETDALHAAFNRAFLTAMFGSGGLPIIMFPATNKLLNPRSKEYFTRTREAQFGKLEELAPEGTEKRARHWNQAKAAWHEIAQWLEADGEEKLYFLGGDRVCYADITLASCLIWIRAINGKDSQEWQDVLTWDDGRWARFMDAFKKYEAVDIGSNVEL